MKYIMLHGLGQSSESWSNTVKVFNDDFEVLCPNLSDWLSGKTPCYDTLYRTLETYCEQFEEPLNICGLSLGGKINCGCKIILTFDSIDTIPKAHLS